MAPDYLILLDIDGTLLHSNGAGRGSMKLALEEVFGTSGDIESYHFGGSTDRDTVFYLMRKAGFHDDDIEAGFLKLPAIMARHIATAPDIVACPGAFELVDALVAHDDALLGLVTGNFMESGFAKLRGAGFDPSVFEVGAYGHISPNRSDLPPAVVEVAYQHTGQHYHGEQVVIVGDTVKDVACGRSVDARVISVLTGYANKAALEAENPYAIIDDLTDLDAVMGLIFR